MESNNRQVKVKIFVLPIIFIAILTAVDQLTKYIVSSTFQLYESKEVIKGVLSFTYIHNEGIAWGMFSGRIPVFVIMTIIVLCAAFYLLYNMGNKKRFIPVKICITILIAGAIGNMIDRVKLGYVIDFFSFDFIDFPVFNVADIYVVVSMILLFILILFVYSNEDIDEIIGIKKMESKQDNTEAEKESMEAKVENDSTVEEL